MLKLLRLTLCSAYVRVNEHILRKLNEMTNSGLGFSFVIVSGLQRS
jgi:hypothetical protein